MGKSPTFNWWSSSWISSCDSLILLLNTHYKVVLQVAIGTKVMLHIYSVISSQHHPSSWRLKGSHHSPVETQMSDVPSPNMKPWWRSVDAAEDSTRHITPLITRRRLFSCWLSGKVHHLKSISLPFWINKQYTSLLLQEESVKLCLQEMHGHYWADTCKRLNIYMTFL